MHLIEILLFSPLLVASIWLGYLNYRILKVTEEVLKVTHNLDRVTMHVDALTQQVVDNTSFPSDLSSSDATAQSQP